MKKTTTEILLIAALGLGIPLYLGSCSAFKPAAKTADAVIEVLCLEYANNTPDLGMAPKDWCAVFENLKIFRDAFLSADQSVGVSR